MSQPLLTFTDVTKHFGGVTAVDGLSMAVPAGAVFGLMGPNGAGKTTALNLLTGFFTPDEGRIEFAGEDVTSLPTHLTARRGISRTYQNVRLFTGMTVREQIVSGMYARRTSRAWQAVFRLPAERAERDQADARAEELLRRVGGEIDPDVLAENLSYGDQRRVEIARAIASEPTLLLLDEPTAGMNASETDAIGELITQLNRDGMTIVVIEHNIRLILDYCDHAFVMSFGQALAEGTPQQCVDDPRVQEAYFGRSNDAERVRALRELRSDPSR